MNNIMHWLKTVIDNRQQKKAKHIMKDEIEK